MADRQAESARADRTRAVVRGPTAFVGRKRERAMTVEALTEGPAVVLIEGEAGIGKTRLVAECLSGCEFAGLRVMEAACPPLNEPFPLGPVVEALQRLLLRHADRLELSALGGALRPLLPELADRLPPALEPLDDPQATRHRILRAAVELVHRAEVDILVVEDVHWADAATLEFLLLLTAPGDQPNPSVVLTYRPTDIPTGSLLLRLTSRTPSQPTRLRVSLAPLDVEAAAELVASMILPEATGEITAEAKRVTAGREARVPAPAPVPAEFAAFLLQRTAGLPLALEETVALLRDRGDLDELIHTGRRWNPATFDDLSVPPTVRDSVTERVDRLRPAARRILRAAAVLTEPADEATLAEVGGLDSDAADLRERGLADALDSGLLRADGPDRYVCRHVLAARAIEETTPISELRRMHAGAATLLRRLDPPPVARLGRHYRAANDERAWLRYAEATADLALASGDDRAAVIGLLEILTAVEHPPARRVRLARKLGTAAAWGVAGLGELGSAVAEALAAVLADMTAPSSAAERGEIRLLLGRLSLQLGEFDAAAEQIEAAAGDLEPRPELAARAMISLALPRGHAWPVARHLQWLERAGRLSSRVDAQEERTWLAVDRASTLLMLGESSGWDAAAELDERLSELDATAPYDPTAALFERRQLARGLMNIGHMAIAWGRDEAAGRRLTAAGDLMRATGYRRLQHSVRLTEAHLDWRAGRWTGLADRIRELMDADDTLPEARLEARLVLALLDLAGGAREPAESELRAVRDDADRRGLLDVLGAPAAALGRLALADGRPEDALEITTPGMDMICRKGIWLWATDLAPVHVRGLLGVGESGRAVDLVGRFEAGLAGLAGLGELDAPAPVAARMLCHAIVAGSAGGPGGADDPVDRFEQAANAWSAIPRPYDELLARELQGDRMLRTRREEGLRLLATVQHRLTELGARWDADRVARVLRSHGAPVHRPWRGGRRGYGDRLSPRESEVAYLVADGLTNRQVAERLFISRRTVDHHLAAAMRKLGVTSRTALALTVADDRTQPADAHQN